jgi:hypothetical protein
MCCLGFALKACGVEDARLTDKAEPAMVTVSDKAEPVMVTVSGKSEGYRFRTLNAPPFTEDNGNGLFYNSRLSIEAIRINDGISSDEYKEEKLTKLFEKYGIELTFVL